MRLLRVRMLAAAVVASAGAANRPATETYRVTFDYYQANRRGEVQGREQISGLYTRDPVRRTSVWSQVGVARSPSDVGPFEPSQPRRFMEGFSYGQDADVLATEFFRGIPATAIMERSLIWDTRMFEVFGEKEFGHLTPDIPYHFQPRQDVALAGAVTFTNNDVQLSLTGRAVRHGVDCWVVDYRALFNPVRIDLPGFSMNGRSHYWGQIWVSRRTKRIEYGTLYEDVLADTTQGTPPGPPGTTNAVRVGLMERINEVASVTR